MAIQLKSVLILLLMLTTLPQCGKAPESATPTMGKITESVYASGVIKSKNQYQVFATVNGLVQQILVKEGDLVKKGAPLMVIQSETSRLSAENAQIAAEYARNNTRGERLAELENAIELARTRLRNDSLLLVRQRGLWAQQIGSQVELEQRELAYTSSINNFQTALLRFRDAQKQLEFSARQTEKQWSISRNLEADYIIKAQNDGRVYSINKEVGELVGPQTPVAVMGDPVVFMAELQVDEKDIARVKPGLRVFLSLDSYKNQSFEAVISGIEPLMNERTRTFTVKADLVQQPAVLYPNLSAEANILIATREQVLLAPRNFLIGDTVAILANKERRRVQIGLKDYQQAEILSGLTAGDKILKPGK
ncbi:MAG TPA: HlyD family efflux transporter periplasmic adaptor subunit [Saprospiraceae bacterium]|nr:HlyD family efflux transporter periplasmic adaptor subunit [Saprospiraceae bacterium]